MGTYEKRAPRFGGRRRKRSHGSFSPRKPRLGIETLEDRRLLSVSLSLNGPQTIMPGATIDVSNASVAPPGSQTEMSLVINPTNPLNVVGFSHSINLPIVLDVYASFDGGINWSLNQIDNGDDGFGVAGNRFDPAIIFDANGTLYVMYGHRETNQTRLISGRSLDGGTTFGQIRTIDLQNDPNANTPGVDKWYLGSGRDPSSDNQAVVGAYVVFATEGMNTDSRISVVGTRDGGNTWTLPLVINDDSAVAAVDSASYASPIIDSLGRLAVSWHDFNDTSIMIDRDTDGLWSNVETFGNDVTVRTGVDVLRAVDKPPAQPQRGINAAPMLEVWRTTNFLYMPVVERFNGADQDIWVGRSTDFGDSWIFNRIDDSLGTEFNPWLQVDQTTGTVNVLYYTTDGDVGTGNDDVRPRLAMSNDGGVTWQRAFLSTQTSNESSGSPTDNDYLEYIGLGVRDGTAHGLWSSRYPFGGTDLNAFTANAAFVSSTGDNRLFIGESGGADDDFLIRQSPVNPAFLEVFVDGVREFTGLSATLDKIIFNPGGGVNTFNVDSLTGIGSITINGTNNVDIYDIVSFGINAPLNIVLGGGDDIVTLGSSPFASQAILSPVTIFGDAGNDTLFLGSNNGDSIDANVTFNGGASAGGIGDRIVFNDTAPSYNIRYDITPTFVTRDGFNLPRAVNYSNTEGIVINAGSGADTVILRNAVAPLVTANGNNGNDIFVVGGGNMTGFVPQIFNGGLGTDQITFDDSLDPTNRIWDMRPGEVIFGGLISLFTAGFESVGLLAGTGNNEITFDGLLTQNFNVDAGGGNDTVKFGFLAKAELAGSLTVTGGTGNDNFLWNRGSNNWSNYGYLSSLFTNPIVLDGGGGFNSLSVDDASRGIARYDLSEDRLRVTEGDFLVFGSDFSYDNMSAIGIVASNSDNVVVVTGVSTDIDLGNQVTILMNGGTDSAFVYPRNAAGDLTINGNIGIVGGSGTDTLTIEDAASTQPIHYAFSNPFGAGTQNVFGLGTQGGLGTATLETIRVNAGSGNDTFALNQFTSGVGLGIDAGGGDDELQFGNNGLGSVTNLAFFDFNGGDGADTFNLNNQTHTGSWTYTRSVGSIAASSTLGAGYFLTDTNTELMRLNGGPSGETFNINAVAAQSRVEANGAGGTDVLRLGPASNNVQSIQGPISFDAGAGGGDDTVTIYNTSDTIGRTLHIENGFVGRVAGDDIFGAGGYLQFTGVGGALTVKLGSGDDLVYVVPNPVTPIIIEGNLPSASDLVGFAFAAVANPIFTPNGIGAGVYAFDDAAPVTFDGVETTVIDDAAPRIVAQRYDDSIVPTIIVEFSEDVSNALSVDDLELVNITNGEQIAFSLMAVSYEDGTNIASYTFPGYPDGILPAGEYTALVSASLTDLFGNLISVTTPLSFSVVTPQPGDTNRDGRVDIDDLNSVRNNFGAVGNEDGTLAGDAFPFDGFVNIDDLNAVRNNFGVAGPVAIVTASSPTMRRHLSADLKENVGLTSPPGQKPMVFGQQQQVTDVIFSMLSHVEGPSPALGEIGHGLPGPRHTMSLALQHQATDEIFGPLNQIDGSLASQYSRWQLPNRAAPIRLLHYGYPQYHSAPTRREFSKPQHDRSDESDPQTLSHVFFVVTHCEDSSRADRDYV